MKLKAFLVILFISFYGISDYALSQEEENPEQTEPPKEEDSKWADHDDEDEFEESFKEDKGWKYWTGTSSINYKIEHPTIEVVYGIMQPSIDKSEFDGDFHQIGALELRLGYSKIKENFFHSNITDYNSSYFFIGNVSEEISTNKEADDNKIATDAWRFGFARSGGYGYNLAKGYNVILYHTDGNMWSKLDFRNEAPNQKSKAAMHAYGDAIRFGSMFESGVKVHLFDYISLNGSFQRSVVFPRHMFWYWVVSEAVSGIGHGLVSVFIDDVIEASPYAGPIVYAVLNAGISYGIYELRKKDMNWPIDTHAPFFNEGFQVGFSFIF
jgi:hypothetical protein